jgi:hypothetical protein
MWKKRSGGSAFRFTENWSNVAGKDRIGVEPILESGWISRG